MSELESCNIVFFRGYYQKLELLSCKDDDHLASLLGFVSDHCVVMNLQVPQEALEFVECRLTSVPANSGTPDVLFSAKVMLKFSVNFSMTLLKIGHMGYLRLMHGPGYLSS